MGMRQKSAVQADGVDSAERSGEGMAGFIAERKDGRERQRVVAWRRRCARGSSAGADDVYFCKASQRGLQEASLSALASRTIF